jgi:hypothetical protein
MKRKTKKSKIQKFEGGGPSSSTFKSKVGNNLGLINGATSMVADTIESQFVDVDKMRGPAGGVYKGATAVGDLLSNSPEPISNMVGQAIKVLTPALAGIGQSVRTKRNRLDSVEDVGNSSLYTTGSFGYADGGNVAQGNTPLIEFKGPKHEQGGIPVDFDQDGTDEAEVEGGETMKNGYIYSDQLGYDKNKRLVLDKSKVKTTFANESKRIENKYKRKTDQISSFTKELQMKKIQKDNNTVLKALKTKESKVENTMVSKFDGGGLSNWDRFKFSLRNNGWSVLMGEADPIKQKYYDLENPTKPLEVRPVQNKSNPVSQPQNKPDPFKNSKGISVGEYLTEPSMSNIPYPVSSNQNTGTFSNLPSSNISQNLQTNPSGLPPFRVASNSTIPATTPVTPAQSSSPTGGKVTVNSTNKTKVKTPAAPVTPYDPTKNPKYDANVAKRQQNFLDNGIATDKDMGFEGNIADGILGNGTKAVFAKQDVILNTKGSLPMIDTKITGGSDYIEDFKNASIAGPKRYVPPYVKPDSKGSQLTQGDKLQLGAAFANYGSKLAQSLKKVDKEPIWDNKNEAAVLAKIRNLKSDTRAARNELNKSVEAGKQNISLNSRSVGNQLANLQKLTNTEMGAKNELSIKEMEFENQKALQEAQTLTSFGESNKNERKQAFINSQQNKAAQQMVISDANNKLEEAVTALGIAKNTGKLNSMQFNMIKELSKSFGYGDDYESFLKKLNAGEISFEGKPFDKGSKTSTTAAATAKAIDAQKNKKENK